MNIFKRLFKKRRRLVNRDWVKYFEDFDRRCLRCERTKFCTRILIEKDENGKCLDFDPVNPTDELFNYDIDKKLLKDLGEL